ncbi:hypothetical protein MsAg5_08270 [Methanosarcinaceae archaeon Ag5]|uniref:ATP-binding protein n=1 Tax=Methanolapillus africanus TaxID=3028297 RepID=A0AAE4MJ86_9EURY|nr:hypothetical protein [Methanosarcinaceae archaeon Ag5]
MLRQEQIAATIDMQKDIFLNKDAGLDREYLERVPISESYATIITGIRRCGKSTLLLQLLQKKYTDALYLNFEDIRLAEFETSDLSRLRDEIVRRKINVLFFDEIQFIDGWEIFVRQLLTEGYTVFVTGSNASLLSRELGTRLTGRHLSMELFPFSYHEYVRLKNLEINEKSLEEYLKDGGMPEYVKKNPAARGGILPALMDDILMRDIAVRYSIRDVEALRKLSVYLMSNIGNPVSASKLTGLFGIKSSTTILEYFSYLKNSYLFEFLPQFGWSLKSQARNPKKVYSIDTGMISEISGAFTENIGHRFENLIYLDLRRKNKVDDLFYFKEKGECDFIVFEKGKAKEAVQVCYKIDDLNFERELNGLMEAMAFFDLTEGTLVTFNQKDQFEKDGLTVRMVPAHEYIGHSD